MKPSLSARLADAAHPFDVILVSLLAVCALPVPGGWAAAVWIGLMTATTFVLRHGSKERASELSRAIVMSPQDGGRRVDDRAPDDRL